MERLNDFYYCEKDDLNYIRKIFLLSRIIFIAWFIYCIYIINPEKTRFFDSMSYYVIGTEGYTDGKLMAFFPLFPMIYGTLDNIFKTDIATYIFNIICSYLSTILIWKISTKVYSYNKETSKNMIFYWLFSPIAFFTIIPYTESVFIFLTLSIIYIYKTKQNPYLLGFLIGLNCFNKSFALIFFLIIAILLAIDIIKENNTVEYFLKTFIVATPIMLIYPLYCFFTTGDIFYFNTSQFEHWHRIPSNIFDIYITDIKGYIFRINTDYDRILRHSLNLIPLLLLTYFIFVFSKSLILNIKNINLEDFILVWGYILFCLIILTGNKKDLLQHACQSIWRTCFSLAPIYLIPKNKLSVIFSIVILTPLNLFLIYNFVNKIFLF